MNLLALIIAVITSVIAVITSVIAVIALVISGIALKIVRDENIINYSRNGIDLINGIRTLEPKEKEIMKPIIERNCPFENKDEELRRYIKEMLTDKKCSAGQ